MAYKLATLLRATTFAAMALSAAGILGCDKSSPPSAQAATSAPQESAAAPSAPVGRLVEVTATSEGYSPSTIEAKAGEQLTLRVTRKTKSECLGEIMIPSLSVKKSLPIDKPVDIPVKVDKPGEIKFSCGMGMVFGKINAT